MAGLRKNPPIELAGIEVIARRDYQSGIVLDVKTGEKTEMELSGSNVLRYDLADNTAVIVRPSGTEPKVKVYILASGETRTECDDKITKYSKWAEALAG
jgi:phosphoglucomutase